MQRRSGVLMHVSSLFGDYSIGSFGNEAMEFIDFLSDSGFGVWQTLPLCMTDEYNSPYKSPSVFSMNPYFLDLPTLFKKGLLTSGELCGARGADKYVCEFSRLKCERMALLFKVASRAKSDKSVSTDMEKFFSAHPYLDLSARFLALKDENGGKPWQEWEREDASEEGIFAHRFIQYELFCEWMEIKKHAEARGVKIIGDIPIYPSLDSADVWAHPEDYLLDGRGYPTELSGAPPDFFSPSGQLWGNPIYNYEKMKKESFPWWRERIRYTSLIFDGIRIDHFRAFDAYWSIPEELSDARRGRWVKGGGKALVDAINEEKGKAFMIAEDLGVITDSVRELLDYSGFFGMRVFQFAFEGDSASPHLPHNFKKSCVAYSATHDNNTTLGYLYDLSPATRAKIFEYCGYGGNDMREGVEYVIDTILRSSAALAVFPMQDILRYGNDTRMNTPGKAEGNWGYRLTKEQMLSLDRSAIRKKNSLFGRC